MAEIRQKILRGTSLPRVAWSTSVWRPHARPRGTCPVSPPLVYRQQEPWASGQSQHPHGLRAQGVLVGGGKTDTISVCPQGQVEEPAGSGLQDLARPHGHVNHEGRQQARAGVRSTQAGAPGAEPWPALAPLGPPNPRQETAELILLGKEVQSLCLCIPQTGSEWAASLLHRGPPPDRPLSSNVCLPFPAAGVPSAPTGQQSFKTKPKSLPSLCATHCKSGGRSGDRTSPLPGPPHQCPRSLMPTPPPWACSGHSHQ